MIWIKVVLPLQMISFLQKDVTSFSIAARRTYNYHILPSNTLSQIGHRSPCYTSMDATLWAMAMGGPEEEQQSMMSMECDKENDPTHHSLAPQSVSPSHSAVQKKNSSILSRLKFWGSSNTQESNSFTFKQKLAKAGMSALLSYGFVSNMSYAVTVSLAWYISSKRTGLSPLQKGQWPGFLAVYAGFYVFNNIIRPARLALAIGVTKYFDSAVIYLQQKLNCSKAIAIGVLVVLANLIGTTLAMSLGIYLASTVAGVPVFPR